MAAKAPDAPGTLLERRAAVARAVMLAPANSRTGEPEGAEVKIARRNSLGLEFALRYPDATSLIAEERGRQEAFRRVMAEASVLLARCRIPHIYIKYDKLYNYYDSNVDIVVRPRDWRPAIAALQSVGYAGHVMFKEPDKIMFERPGERVSVHLHPGVTWNGVPYFKEEELWANASQSLRGAWQEMSDEYDYLINLAHNVFENYEVSLGDLVYFRTFLHTRSINPGRLEEIAAANGWRQGFQRLDAKVTALVHAWDEAASTDEIPSSLLIYPYRIAAPALMRAFGERIAANLRYGRIYPALREAYAYPAFYALKLRHDLPFVSG